MKETKDLVKDKYGKIALEIASGCCSPGTGCGSTQDRVFENDYSSREGYVKDADLGLGCGLPLEFARIKARDTVVDLGSGAGNDCFIALSETGPEGKVIGVDFTEAMVARAKENASKLQYNNVQFVQGDIEDIPLEAELADVVVSNCVFNLVPDKSKAFAETHRILKTGGHFSISDIVLEGSLPEGLQKAAENFAGCVSGAIQLSDYLALVKDQGFKNIQLQKKNGIDLPGTILDQYFSPTEKADYNAKRGIYSVTIYAEK